jgi:hypothetical protein
MLSTMIKMKITMLNVTALITWNVTERKPYYDLPSIMKGCYFDIPCVWYVRLFATWMNVALGVAMGSCDAVVNCRLLLVMWFCFVRMSVVSTWLFRGWIISEQGRSDIWQTQFLCENVYDLTLHNTAVAICMVCLYPTESWSPSKQYLSA